MSRGGQRTLRLVQIRRARGMCVIQLCAHDNIHKNVHICGCVSDGLNSKNVLKGKLLFRSGEIHNLS